MRTIDPFLAPGLWGGPPALPQSSVTAGGCSGPPQLPAVIASPAVQRPFAGHAPLASLAGSVLGPRFHAWYGASGRRTICSVYPVRMEEENRGLPDFAWAIVIAAGRDRDRIFGLSVFAFGEGQDRTAPIANAIAAGAVEWHVHLLAEDETARRSVLRDLGGL